MIDDDTYLLIENYNGILLNESYKVFKSKLKGDYDKAELQEYIEKFKELKKRNIIPYDITKYYGVSFDEFKQFVDQSSEKKSKKQLKKKTEWDIDNLHTDAKLVQDNDKFTTIRVFSHEAARHYGSNTKWCIVANEDYWDKYFNLGNAAIFMILAKNLPKYNKEKSENIYKKLCIVVDNDEMSVWNSPDDNISNTKNFSTFYEFFILGGTSDIDPIRPILEQMKIVDIDESKINSEFQAINYIVNGVGDKNKIMELFISNNGFSIKRLLTYMEKNNDSEAKEFLFKNYKRLYTKETIIKLIKTVSYLFNGNELPKEFNNKMESLIKSLFNGGDIDYNRKKNIFENLINVDNQYNLNIYDNILKQMILDDEDLTQWYMFNTPKGYSSDIHKAFDNYYKNEPSTLMTYYLNDSYTISNTYIDNLMGILGKYILTNNKWYYIEDFVESLKERLSPELEELFYKKVDEDVRGRVDDAFEFYSRKFPEFRN